MGFFKKLKQTYQQQMSERLAADFRATKERIEEQERFEREYAIFEKRNKDTAYQRENAKYWNTSMEIDEKYSILTNLGDFNTPAADKLLEICYEQIDRAKRLREKWALYNEGAGRINAYQRIAMIYEKRGEHLKAAEACLMAVNDGQKEDGTKGGMLGRMTRMLKKGGLEPTEEMKAVLLKAFND